MPPPEVKEVEPEKPPAKNIFMDIYAQEMSKMQTSAKSSGQSKKRNFDASQFNAYGLPLGELTEPRNVVAATNSFSFTFPSSRDDDDVL